MNKLISIDIKANFGFLKKPDINESIYLTFNTLHKPGLLGILGAVAGLGGYNREGQLPEYYIKLKHLKVGIRPLNAERGNFAKTVVKYNNSVGYASREPGCILNVSEQILIRPQFRVYLLLSENNALHQKIEMFLANCEAEFLPYLGKNEFSLWWENYREYEYEPFQYDSEYRISTIFMKGEQIIKKIVIKRPMDWLSRIDDELEFANFEELPVGLDEQLMQYQKERFVFTNFTLPKEARLVNLYRLKESNEIIQLF